MEDPKTQNRWISQFVLLVCGAARYDPQFVEEDFTELVQIYGYAGDWHRALHLLEEWTDDPRIPNPKPHLVTESARAYSS